MSMMVFFTKLIFFAEDRCNISRGAGRYIDSILIAVPRPDGAAVRSKQKRKEEIIEKGTSVKTDAFEISYIVRVCLLKNRGFQ